MKWLKKYTAQGWDLKYSTDKNRIVLLREGIPVEVVPSGNYRVPLIFRNFDELALIDLDTKTEEYHFGEEDILTTSEGLVLTGKISISIKAKSSDVELMRLSTNSSELFLHFSAILRTALKTEITGYSWSDLYILNKENLMNIVTSIQRNLDEKDLSFEVVNILALTLSPSDRDFAKELEDRKKDHERRKSVKAKLEAKKETTYIEHEISKKELANSEELENLKHEGELHRLQMSQKADIESRRTEMEYKKEEINSFLEFIEKNPAALALINPELYREIELAKINSDVEKQKLLESIVMKQISHEMGMVKGQFNVMNALAADRLGIDAEVLYKPSELRDPNESSSPSIEDPGSVEEGDSDKSETAE